MTEYKSIYDVVVVGAGPVGLATAVGLRKRGIKNILVIDQTRAFRQVGQVLDLLPNGLKALKSLDPRSWEEVKKAGMSFFDSQNSNNQEIEANQEKRPKTKREWLSKNLQGQLTRSMSLEYDDWFKDYGEGRVSIHWYNLQTTLRQLLPEDQVKANHRCVNIVNEVETNCVKVECVSNIETEANPYAYWAEEQKDHLDTTNQQSEIKSIRAKLVVAADGINSTIRRVLYTNSQYSNFARPEYSGFAAISCTNITEIPEEVLKELEDKFFDSSSIVTISDEEISKDLAPGANPRMILFRRASGLRYVMHLALPLNSLEGKSGSCLIQLAAQELEKAGFPDALKQLVGISPAENMQQRPYYIHRAASDSIQIPSQDYSIKNQPAWSAERVVLVGDAAHGMPPFMAQGANQGFEDALYVVTLIAKIAQDNKWDNMEVITKSFEKFESLRRPLMAYIQKATLTIFPYSSDKDRQDYNQKVYGRNFDQVVDASNT